MSKRQLRVKTLDARTDSDIICLPVDIAGAPSGKDVQAFRIIIQTNREVVELIIGKSTSLRTARTIISYLRGQMEGM